MQSSTYTALLLSIAVAMVINAEEQVGANTVPYIGTLFFIGKNISLLHNINLIELNYY